MEQAQDLAQDFFAHLLRQNVLCGDDLQTPEFRHFLLACLDNCLVNQWYKRQAWMRGGRLQIVSWETIAAEEQCDGRACQEETPETVCYRAWAVDLLEKSLTSLRKEYIKAGKAELFETIEPSLSGRVDSGWHGRVAAELNMSQGAVRVAVHRLRRRFAELLRREIGRTVDSPEDIDTEIRALLAVCGR